MDEDVWPGADAQVRSVDDPRVPATDDARRNREAQLVDEPVLEQLAQQCGATFGVDPAKPPAYQSIHRRREIDIGVARDDDIALTQVPMQPVQAGARGRGDRQHLAGSVVTQALRKVPRAGHEGERQ